MRNRSCLRATIARLKCTPFLWTRVAAHTVAEGNGATGNGWYRRVAAIFATPLASAIVLLLVIAVGLVYVKSSRQPRSKPTVAKERSDPMHRVTVLTRTKPKASRRRHTPEQIQNTCRVESKTKAPSQTGNPTPPPWINLTSYLQIWVTSISMT